MSISMTRALHNAWMLGVSKGEPAQGAKILDRALQRESPASAAERVRALSCALTSPAPTIYGSP